MSNQQNIIDLMNENAQLKDRLASARKALEAVAGMIHGEMIEAAIVDTSTMKTLGEVVQSALTDPEQK